MTPTNPPAGSTAGWSKDWPESPATSPDAKPNARAIEIAYQIIGYSGSPEWIENGEPKPRVLAHIATIIDREHAALVRANGELAQTMAEAKTVIDLAADYLSARNLGEPARVLMGKLINKGADIHRVLTALAHVAGEGSE